MKTFSCSLLSSSSVSHPFLPSLRPVPAAAPYRSKRPAIAPGPGGISPAALRRDDAYGADSGGRFVDEGMIVLRTRLREMRAADMNDEPPSHWMGWEKRCYGIYDADVCHLVQSFLMNTRPSAALGLLVLLCLSVPTSAVVVALNLVEVMKRVLGSFIWGS